jgi:hypothetical protein
MSSTRRLEVRLLEKIVTAEKPFMVKELLPALTFTGAALVLQAHAGKLSVSALKDNPWAVVLPYVIIIAIFIFAHVSVNAWRIGREVRAASRRLVDPYPSLVLPERQPPISASPVPRFYVFRLIFCTFIAAAFCVGLCLFVWNKSTDDVNVLLTPTPLPSPTAPPVTSPAPTPSPASQLIIKVTPHVVVQRVPGKGEILPSALYGFSVVLYVQNNSSAPVNIRQLEIVGDVPVDFSEYFSTAPDGAGIDDVGAEFNKRQPYYSISLVAHTEEGRVDSEHGERFLRFDFMESANNYGARWYAGPLSDYIGFRHPATKPKRLTTEPNLKDLVTFREKEKANYQEWRFPKLRPEITNGTVKFIVLVDSIRIPLKTNDVNSVQWILLPDWKNTNTADLYFRGELGRPIDRARGDSDPATQRH